MSGAPSFAAALRETLQAAVGAAIGGAAPPSQDELFEMLKQRQFQGALYFLQQHPQLWAARDAGGHTPLHWAALGGSLEVLRAGLAAGVPADARGAGLETPLMWAVFGGEREAAEALLRAHADAQVRDPNGATLLIVAIQQSRHTVAQALATHGGPEMLGAVDRRGCTAAHWAAHLGDVRGLRLLEYLLAELHTVDAEGMSPLHRAVVGGHAEAVDFLLERSADVTLRTSLGSSSLDIMSQRGNRPMQALVLRSAFRRQLKLKEQAAAQGSPTSTATGSGGGGLCTSAGGPLKVSAWAPVGVGVAACWRGGGGPDECERAAGGDLQKAASFDIENCKSREELLQELAKRLPDLEDGVACVWAADSAGTPLDLLSAKRDALPPGCSSVRVHLLQIGTAAPARSLRSASPLDCALTRRMWKDPELFGGVVLTTAPHDARWEVWKELLQVRTCELPSSNGYREISQKENEWTQLITADANRTFKGYDERQRQCLLRVLNAYAAYNPGVGYCQGMNRVAGLLLLLSGCEREEECFAVLACLMDRLGLKGFFEEGFPLLGRYMEASSHLLEERVPDLIEHFLREGVEPDMYLRQWFLTLFIDCLPLPLVVSVWDAIIRHGLSFSLRVAVALLEALKETLLTLHFPDHSVLMDTLKVLRELFTSKSTEGLWLGQLLVEYASAVDLPEGFAAS